MTGASLIGVGSALAFVLGLIALLTRALKGFAPGSSIGAASELEVLARTALAPKQGVAAIRFAGRRALVSYGEGGVRLLLEDEAPEADRETRRLPVPRSRSPRSRACWPRPPAGPVRPWRPLPSARPPRRRQAGVCAER